jgi:hypothetical protein
MFNGSWGALEGPPLKLYCFLLDANNDSLATTYGP